MPKFIYTETKKTRFERVAIYSLWAGVAVGTVWAIQQAFDPAATAHQPVTLAKKVGGWGGLQSPMDALPPSPSPVGAPELAQAVAAKTPPSPLPQQWLASSGYELLNAYVSPELRGQGRSTHPYAGYTTAQLKAMATAGDTTAQFLYAIDIGEDNLEVSEKLLLDLYSRGNQATLQVMTYLHNRVAKIATERLEMAGDAGDEPVSGHVARTEPDATSHVSQSPAALKNLALEHALKRDAVLAIAAKSGDPMAQIYSYDYPISEGPTTDERRQYVAQYKERMAPGLQVSASANKGLSSAERDAVASSLKAADPAQTGAQPSAAQK